MIRKIAIIGPECTGKTTLSEQLALHFNTVWVPEYAREYVLKLSKHYTYDDVLMIAEKQRSQIHTQYNNVNKFVFFDTELIITKVWFDIVYNKKPVWIDEAIVSSGFDLYLLCNTDLPWEPDVVRENGGEMREMLFDMYKEELEKFNLKYHVISGKNIDRIAKAVDVLELM